MTDGVTSSLIASRWGLVVMFAGLFMVNGSSLLDNGTTNFILIENDIDGASSKGKSPRDFTFLIKKMATETCYTVDLLFVNLRISSLFEN